jgi:hypothetical protein
VGHHPTGESASLDSPLKTHFRLNTPPKGLWDTKNAFSRSEFLQVLMGIFYYVKSVALSEDLAIDHSAAHTAEAFYMAAERSYTQVCTTTNTK